MDFLAWSSLKGDKGDLLKKRYWHFTLYSNKRIRQNQINLSSNRYKPNKNL